ncbi:putative mitochondrial ribosomal protein S6-2 precursor [Plasmodium gaboni]|uniref:Mitochondrial ribosomal protein S6-2, putative n=1 Tax=Plasmodium gaboni TaxID=647221 RepID=A0A151LBI6_9APIC|nr:putative mitochondrial ribosomal protein S6-2 precursor [Plasmodium gaboni]XP_028540968.1 mitochondrial ribosomal protein S6-2 precursor, putative [Plasmodium sp. gorilla clade G2]SOV25357.1 mitochondrial ribosomal protein S6-2 precursor, putative [Plasmodium sp. DRC-Itaito]KYN96226.1 putative mitochondrial ribosomal protein S6-2 precursor [Plasmodium gaboni]SOV19686.1 mitochondrial ribosomal protein S6-2 precursor, putative [Plasmodium gaboni]SOV19768.1 mitochondrial ribosomal protein S6-2
MVLYESYISLNKHIKKDDVRNLMKNFNYIINKHNGNVISINDLGWRKFAFCIKKPKVGTFHFGRFYCITFYSNSQSIKDLNEFFHSNTYVLRFLNMKMKYRSNFLVAPFSYINEIQNSNT